jgi:hypothetical protein
VVLIIGGQAHRVMRARWHAEARVLMLNTAPLSNLE